MPIWNGVGGGVVFNSSSSFFSPMRAWLEQPHGRHHKAPPQPCALTTSRSASGGVFRTAGARTGNSPPSSSGGVPRKEEEEGPGLPPPFLAIGPFPNSSGVIRAECGRSPKVFSFFAQRRRGGRGDSRLARPPPKSRLAAPRQRRPSGVKTRRGLLQGTTAMDIPARIPAVGSRGRGARWMEAGADEATAPAALFRSRCAGLASGGGGARKCFCRRWRASGRRRPRPPSTAARTSLAVPTAPAAVRRPTLANNHSATQDRRCAGARAGAAGRQRWPSLSRRPAQSQHTTLAVALASPRAVPTHTRGAPTRGAACQTGSSGHLCGV